MSWRTVRRIAAGGALLATIVAGCAVSQHDDKPIASPNQSPSPAPAAVQSMSTSATVPLAPATSVSKGSSSWVGTGVFSVGATPSRGLKAAIPPGRYRIELDDPTVGTASVIRCSDIPCSPAQNYLGSDTGFGADYVSAIDVLGSDAVVRLDNAKLTPIGE